MGDGKQVAIWRRRLVLAGIALASALTLRAQPKPRRVGLLLTGSVNDEDIARFKAAMQALGYAEGRGIEYFLATEPEYDKLTAATKRLMAQHVEIVVASGGAAAQAVDRNAPGLPIVMAGGFDPVQLGLANNLAKPGRSTTGVTQLGDRLLEKHLQLVREVLPTARRVAFVHAPGYFSNDVIDKVTPLARDLKLEMARIPLGIKADLQLASFMAREAKPEAVIVIDPGALSAMIPEIVQLATELHALSVFPHARYVEHGGMLSYGANPGETFERAAPYCDRILKGAKPGDLPIEQSTRFELVVNAAAAKRLKIPIPQSVLLRADRVIE